MSTPWKTRVSLSGSGSLCLEDRGDVGAGLPLRRQVGADSGDGQAGQRETGRTEEWNVEALSGTRVSAATWPM